jgi:hypothetical protein
MALAFSRTASWAGAWAGLVLRITLATATTVQSTVMEVDSRGMATVKTEGDKGQKVKGEGWKTGARVEYANKEGKTERQAM